jgi:hypothetical protein
LEEDSFHFFVDRLSLDTVRILASLFNQLIQAVVLESDGGGVTRA